MPHQREYHRDPDHLLGGLLLEGLHPGDLLLAWQEDGDHHSADLLPLGDSLLEDLRPADPLLAWWVDGDHRLADPLLLGDPLPEDLRPADLLLAQLVDGDHHHEGLHLGAHPQDHRPDHRGWCREGPRGDPPQGLPEQTSLGACLLYTSPSPRD